MVPSLSSLTYYLVSLYLLVMWSLHLGKGRAATVARCLRIGLVLYSTLHLVVLHLYQFQSAQDHIPLQPDTTTTSLLARCVCLQWSAHKYFLTFYPLPLPPPPPCPPHSWPS